MRWSNVQSWIHYGTPTSWCQQAEKLRTVTQVGYRGFELGRGLQPRGQAGSVTQPLPMFQTRLQIHSFHALVDNEPEIVWYN